ncbi:MAG: hypothetical protein AAGF73_11115 [Actinomycetota bacterium]
MGRTGRDHDDCGTPNCRFADQRKWSERDAQLAVSRCVSLGSDLSRRKTAA